MKIQLWVRVQVSDSSWCNSSSIKEKRSLEFVQRQLSKRWKWNSTSKLVQRQVSRISSNRMEVILRIFDLSTLRVLQLPPQRQRQSRETPTIQIIRTITRISFQCNSTWTTLQWWTQQHNNNSKAMNSSMDFSSQLSLIPQNMRLLFHSLQLQQQHLHNQHYQSWKKKKTHWKTRGE